MRLSRRSLWFLSVSLDSANPRESLKSEQTRSSYSHWQLAVISVNRWLIRLKFCKNTQSKIENISVNSLECCVLIDFGDLVT